MKKIWIVYRVSQGYEDQEEDLFAAETDQAARAAAKRINEFMAALRARLQRLPDPFEDGISGEQHCDRWGRRQKVITSARWPFGSALESDIGQSGDIAAVRRLAVISLKSGAAS